MTITFIPSAKIEILNGMREKPFEWKEIKEERSRLNSSVSQDVGKVSVVDVKDESEDKVVRDLQEFLQLGGERRIPLKPIDLVQQAGVRIFPVQGNKKATPKQYREPPVIIVKKVPEGKEKGERIQEPMKKVPDVTKSAKQITGQERETYLRDMKDSILRDLNPLVLKSLVNQRCGETHIDFSSKYYEPEPQTTNWSKHLVKGDPLWSDTDKYKFKSVFKDIKSSIECFEGASGSANATNKFDINEMEMNKAPKRMYRKKMGDEKLEAWYQYNLYKSLQLPEEARRKAEAEAWLKSSPAASISLDLRGQDSSANMGFIESRSLDSMTSDFSFDASEILGSSTPINPMLAHTKNFSKHYASFNTSDQ